MDRLRIVYGYIGDLSIGRKIRAKKIVYQIQMQVFQIWYSVDGKPKIRKLWAQEEKQGNKILRNTL